MFGQHIECSMPHCTFNASTNRVWNGLLKKKLLRKNKNKINVGSEKQLFTLIFN